MVDAGIGRLLVASLHQAVAEVLPERLEFYGHWLSPGEGGERRIGLASLGAVVSFLRTEGRSAYIDVMTHAGRLAAEWSYQARPAFEHRLVSRLPGAVRARASLRWSRRLVRETYRRSRAATRLRRGRGSVAIHDSIFCTGRAPADAPLCAFYAAGIARLLALCAVPARVALEECRATGSAACRVTVALDAPCRPARVDLVAP